MRSSYRYLFGPVRSGRLGLSLGVDCLGEPICSFDCPYCEVGATAVHTDLRKPYVPVETLGEEMRRWRGQFDALPDVVTLGGMGEPTLNSDLGAIIELAREVFAPAPVAVLTNASLFSDPAVRAELARADIVLPSLDSLVPSEFQAVNRPVAGLDVGDIARGILDFRREYKGLLYLEVLLLEGVNDSDANLRALETYLAELKPDRVDVVTMTRPGASEAAMPVERGTLDRFRQALCAGDAPPAREQSTGKVDKNARLGQKTVIELARASISRRPQTAGQLARALSIPRSQAKQVLTFLVADSHARKRLKDGRTYYDLSG